MHNARLVKKYILAVFGMIALCGTACEKKRTAPGPEFITVSMGDPNVLIEGYEGSEKYVPMNLFSESDKIQVVSGATFVQTNKYSTAPRKNSQVGNEASKDQSSAVTDEEIAKKYRYELVKESEEKHFLKSRGQNFSIEFKQVEGDLYTVDKVSDYGGTNWTEAELAHFSISKDKRFFSLLLRYKFKFYGTGVEALYFSRNINPKTPQKNNTNNYYLKGPGVVYRWDKSKPLEISHCGKSEDFNADVLSHTILQKESKVATQSWKKALTGLIDVQFKENMSYTGKPFSDLNQTCIWLIDGIKNEPHPQSRNLGMALSVLDDEKHLMAASVVFVFKKEFEKRGENFADDSLKSYRERTILHELGHLLGLDHQFDEGAKSVMSYDFKTTDPKLYDYDINAIQSLYK